MIKRVPNGVWTIPQGGEASMITDNDYFYVNPDKIVGLTETSGTGNLEQLDGQPGLLVEYADSYLFMIFPAWSHEHVAEWVNV